MERAAEVMNNAESNDLDVDGQGDGGPKEREAVGQMELLPVGSLRASGGSSDQFPSFNQRVQKARQPRTPEAGGQQESGSCRR